MNGPLDPTSKRAWRTFARAARRSLDRDAWSRELVAALRAWGPYRGSITVATYLPFGDEPDLSSLTSDRARLAAPRIDPDDGRLRFHLLGGPLERHPFGMDEPRADAPEVPAETIDLVLVPGLAFDRSGARLGYGRGFYDVFLAGLAPDVPRVGIAHPALVADSLPTERHDVPMTHLALPDGVVACARR